MNKENKAYNHEHYKYQPLIIFITGASGSGKTTLVKELGAKLPANISTCLHFDSVGVPSEAEMLKTYGSISEWQKVITYQWIEKIINDYTNKKIVIIEGQVNLEFIISAFKKFGYNRYKIVLMHCDNFARHKRLNENRNQPELINKQMDYWAEFLYQQASEKQVKIFDSTFETVDKLVSMFEDYIYEELSLHL